MQYLETIREGDPAWMLTQRARIILC